MQLFRFRVRSHVQIELQSFLLLKEKNKKDKGSQTLADVKFVLPVAAFAARRGFVLSLSCRINCVQEGLVEDANMVMFASRVVVLCGSWRGYTNNNE
jgi:hypothetical protein